MLDPERDGAIMLRPDVDLPADTEISYTVRKYEILKAT